MHTTALDDLPEYAIVLDIPVNKILDAGACTLKLSGITGIEKKSFLLVEDGKAYGVVRFGKRNVITSGRGHSVDKGIAVQVTAKFSSPLKTNVPKNWHGVFANVKSRIAPSTQVVTKATWRVGADRNLPIVEGTWDGAAAKSRIFSWAGFDDDNPDSSKARRAFLAYDADASELKGSYKLPFADLIDGELKAVTNGLNAAASRLPQTDIPDSVKETARNVLDGYAQRAEKSQNKEAEEDTMATSVKTAMPVKPKEEKAKKPKRKPSYTKGHIMALAREARQKQEVDVDLSGEGGIHQHDLDRENQTTLTDGAHQHIFIMPDGETVFATALDGAHPHGLKTPSADVSEAGVSAHSHNVVLPDGTEVATAEDGEHMHALQVRKSAVDGLHQHELSIGDGTTLLSLTPGQFWALFSEEGETDGEEVERSIAQKAFKVTNTLSGVTLTAPALTLLDTNDDRIVIQASDTLTSSMRRTLENELAKRLGDDSNNLVVTGREFGVPHTASAVLAEHRIDFSYPKFLGPSPSLKATAVPIGPQKAVLQYLFKDDGRFDVAFRFQHNDSTLSWVLDADRAANLHSVIKTVDEAKAAVRAASFDGSRYQRPIRGCTVKATRDLCKGHTLLEHTGKVFAKGHTNVAATVDGCTVTYGLQLDGFHEYFLTDSQNISGILTIKSVIQPDGERGWEATIGRNLPAVLSKHAVDAGIMPLYGQSGLPGTLEREIPPELQYWRAATPEDARKIRDALVKSQFFSTSNIYIVDGAFRRVEPTTSYAINKVLPEAASHGDAIPTPPKTEDPVRRVAQMLPDAGSSVVLFDKSLAATMSARDVATAAADLDGEDFLIAYPDTPGARLALSQCGRLFKLAGHAQTLFVTSGAMGTNLGIEWLSEPDDRWVVSSNEKVSSLLKRIGDHHNVPVYKSGAEERFVLGIVLEPETVDAQDDIYSADEVRKACHLYMQEFGHIKLMHDGAFVDSKVKILENYIAPVSFSVDGNSVKKGTWILGARVLDDHIWEGVKSGKFTGFSIGGMATKMPL